MFEMSDFDSDETVGSESDETLPPDLEDRNHSPDLFDEVTDMKKKPEISTMRRNRSKVHDLSDSDSDHEVKHNKIERSPEKVAVKKDVGVKSIKDKKSTASLKKESSPLFNKNSKNASPKSKKDEERRERQKFISEFLDMAFSDPENESNEIDKMIENGRTNNVDSGTSSIPTKPKGSSFPGKPYKQDYSKPFSKKDAPSSSHKHVKHSGKNHLSSDNSKQTYDKEKTLSISKQSPSSMKRKHSLSPVPQELRKAGTKIWDDNNSSKSVEKKPACKYGSDCYRKNPSHLEEFYHPVPKSKLSSKAEDSPPPSKKQRTTTETPSTSKQLTKSRSSSPSLKVKDINQSVLPSTSSKVCDKSIWSSSPTQTLKNGTSTTKCRDTKSSVVSSTASRACDLSTQSRSYIQTPKNVTEKFEQAQPYSFFLTKVHGISDEYNSSFAMDIKDILSAEMGNLTASCQFNFMFEIPWLVKQYPPEFRSKPLLIVHGEQGASKAKLQGDAMTYTNIKFCQKDKAGFDTKRSPRLLIFHPHVLPIWEVCELFSRNDIFEIGAVQTFVVWERDKQLQAKLEMMYGTHHTKMMLLLYDTGMRVVIHTSNLIERDWYQKTQGMWISPVFPRLDTPGREKGDSPTLFKRDLINYIAAYKAYQLKEWIEHIERHDMSSARVVILGSVPGRHQGDFEKSKWGHLKLRKVLKQHGPDPSIVKTWPVIGQFSSIGSMGPNKENWVCGEFLESLAATKASSGLQTNTRLQLIFPSKDNVRLSLEGFPAGGSIPYSVNTAKKQTYLHEFFHVWTAEGRGRSRAMPHIKTYVRPKQDGTMASWFIVTSANLSKAAWGALEKKGVQLMIRSYEIGVLFLPQFFDVGDILKTTNSIDEAKHSFKFLLPYDLPAQKYEKKDRPWMWDIPYMDLPDTNGNVWCPFSK